MGGGGGGGTSQPTGTSELGPYTQSIVNNMRPVQPLNVRQQQIGDLQSRYDETFGTQPSFQSMANANALRMIDNLMNQQGVLSLQKPVKTSKGVTPSVTSKKTNASIGFNKIYPAK